MSDIIKEIEKKMYSLDGLTADTQISIGLFEDILKLEAKLDSIKDRLSFYLPLIPKEEIDKYALITNKMQREADNE